MVDTRAKGDIRQRDLSPQFRKHGTEDQDSKYFSQKIKMELRVVPGVPELSTRAEIFFVDSG
jgi:hypothetical protein